MSDANLLTSQVAIPAGSWLTLQYSQNLLGALNLSTSWANLAQQWAAYLPDSWNQQTIIVNDTLARHSATVQVQVPTDTTVGAVATIANNISADVSILGVVINGSTPASPTTLQQQADNTGTSFAKCLSDPASCLPGVTGLTILIVVLITGYLLLSTGAGKRLAARVK